MLAESSCVLDHARLRLDGTQDCQKLHDDYSLVGIGIVYSIGLTTSMDDGESVVRMLRSTNEGAVNINMVSMTGVTSNMYFLRSPDRTISAL
jgi:hypothetical protein